MMSSSTLRALPVIGLLALGAAAHAQVPKADRMEKARTELQKRFEAADTNKDGKLTREEAQAKMPKVYKNFDAIDASHAGAISLADIEAFVVSKKGARKPAG
jgi:Ca2+-binding EF-hand superfamily protein